MNLEDNSNQNMKDKKINPEDNPNLNPKDNQSMNHEPPNIDIEIDASLRTFRTLYHKIAKH